MKLGIIEHPVFLQHEMGAMHPESPMRVQVISRKLKASNIADQLNYYKASSIPKSYLYQAHVRDYVDEIFNYAPQNQSDLKAIDPDTLMNHHTLEAALYAAGSVKQAVDLVMEKKEFRIFCNARPPGHHAEKSRAMGFCFFNNIALGALYALNTYSLKKVAIVDFDVHQGNGTLDILKDEGNVLYASSYQTPFYPFTPEINNSHIISIPLRANTSAKDVRDFYENRLFPELRAFRPEIIFISAGFDAYYLDPLADQMLQEEDYHWLTSEIVKIANTYCSGRIISALEGGYKIPELGDCVLAHCRGLLAAQKE